MKMNKIHYNETVKVLKENIGFYLFDLMMEVSFVRENNLKGKIVTLTIKNI